MDYNDAIIKYSISKEESILAKLKAEHESAVKDYNKTLKACYAFIPEGMYKAYATKAQTFDDTEFNKEFSKFLEGLGIEVGSAIVPKWVRKLTSAIGVSMATQKTLLTGAESLTKAMSKTCFNKVIHGNFYRPIHQVIGRTIQGCMLSSVHPFSVYAVKSPRTDEA